MATTIDSLQIEIQSNSTNATSGIDGLAKALKKLSKNSDIKEAVNGLNDLRKSLHAFVNVPTNVSKIDSLAKSLKSLSKIKVNVGDSIASVQKSIESLGAMNVDSVAPQIERIAGALAPLSNTNGSGFNNMMNALKKLGDVSDSLDDETIANFVAKVKKLDEELGPLSTKMTAINGAFNAVNGSASAAGNGFSSLGKKVNITTLNLQSMISVAKSAYATLQPVINLLKNTISAAMEWDGISARFGSGFGESANEVYSWVKRLNEEMGINTQQFMQYSSVYATMLEGFGVNSKDAAEMALGYTELTYDIWARYNDIYKSYEDAAIAVRAAIAGETEPIQKAGLDVRDSALKQTAALNGLTYSTQNTTNAQKSYLRYLSLVREAEDQGLVGSYAREMDTAEGMIRTFRQQLTSLAQAFGSVFLPALVQIMPWVNAFVELMNEAVLAVARFFNIDIQPVDFSNASKGAGEYSDKIDEATKSAKELKNATIGIDELNVISPPSSGSGDKSSDWNGSDVSSLWDESILGKIQFEVEAIKQKLKDALSGITALISGFSLVIGTIMVFAGANIPLGIALMAAGAAGLATAVAVNWNGMSDQLAGTLTTITSVLSGFLLTFGACLAFTGVNVPLGIGLMAAGAASLGTAVAINWTFLKGDLANAISILTGVVSGGLLILGAIFAFSGVAVGKGIALMAAGSAGLVSSAVLNWDSVKTTIANVINSIGSWLKTYGLLVLGVLLCFTVNPLVGASMIATGLGITTSSGSTVGDELFKAIKDKWASIKSWWSKNVKFTIPSLSFNVSYSNVGLGTIKKAIVNALNLPGWPKLSFAKDGGMFDMGSLIWAGEAGAEVVANAGGGKTGVMNIQQMQEAVYEGVYAAVVGAMRQSESGGSQPVNLYLDGRLVARSVEKYQRERGTTFVGQQAFTY